jgi:hypothetical protein
MSYEKSKLLVDKFINGLIDTATKGSREIGLDLTLDMFNELMVMDISRQIQKRPELVAYILASFITREYERRKTNQEKSSDASSNQQQ